MDKSHRNIVIVVIAFILAYFEPTRGRYLLVKLSQEMDSGFQEQMPEVRASLHNRCGDCIRYWCQKEHRPKTLANLLEQCTQYIDVEKYPSKKNLVNCGLLICYKAKNEIEEHCVDGTSPYLEPTHLRRTCNDNY